MTIQSNYDAAGANATTDRVEVKQSWFKKPYLHVGIAIAAIFLAVIIGSYGPFNLYLKLLLGVALLWGGGKMGGATNSAVKVWGKVFKGLGFLIIVVALLKSGVGAMAEKSVTWVDQTLTETATGSPQSAAPLSEEEQKKRLARQRQEAEVAAQQAITDAIAREASRIATERTQVGMLQPAPTRSCARYAGQSNCVEAVFGAHTVYDRVAKKGMCIVADPVRATTRTDLGGDQYRYTAKPGAVVEFFDLPVGQSAAGTRCG